MFIFKRRELIANDIDQIKLSWFGQIQRKEPADISLELKLCPFALLCREIGGSLLLCDALKSLRTTEIVHINIQLCSEIQINW